MNASLVPGASYRDFVEAAVSCRTEANFRRTAFFDEHRAALELLLSNPQVRALPELPSNAAATLSSNAVATLSLSAEATPSAGAAPTPSAVPPTIRQPTGLTIHSTPPSLHTTRRAPVHDPSVLRVVHWNIEKGKQLDRILERLTQDPYLADADVYCLNEVDVGMARSGNVDVAAVLADALQCDSVFVPSYLECTKGPDEEAQAPGENRLGLHGLAILSRHPIERVKVVALPSCFDYFSFFEKRFGGRQGLLAEIAWNGRPVIVATTHLEVRDTPECRAKQLAPLLPALAEFRASPGQVPCVLTGDLNTNSFRRGTLDRAAREFVRIVTTPPQQLDAELLAPFAREPVFALAERAGFSFRPHTDGQPTASQVLGGAEDLRMLPGPLRELVSRTYGLSGRVLRMRLDWILSQGFVPAGRAQTHDPIVSGGKPASDHALISAEVALSS